MNCRQYFSWLNLITNGKAIQERWDCQLQQVCRGHLLHDIKHGKRFNSLILSNMPKFGVGNARIKSIVLTIVILSCACAYSLARNSAPAVAGMAESVPVEEIAKDEAIAKKNPILQNAKYRVERIIIDPGHGGKDPGTVTKDGLQEKAVTLDVALKTAEFIRNRLKKEVILTRDKDVYVGLHQRVRIANKNGGDLFLSIHVNANASDYVHGPKVYTRSSMNADRTSRMLALRENLGCIKPESMRRILSEPRSKMIDHLSVFLAGNILGNILNDVDAETRNKYIISQAPFYVVEHANMPAVLLEVGFITNSEEKRKIGIDDFRSKMAAAICKGIEEYIRATTLGKQ